MRLLSEPSHRLPCLSSHFASAAGPYCAGHQDSSSTLLARCAGSCVQGVLQLVAPGTPAVHRLLAQHPHCPTPSLCAAAITTSKARPNKSGKKTQFSLFMDAAPIGQNAL